MDRNSRRLLAAATGALVMGLATSAGSQTSVPAADAAFMKKAAIGGMAEVQLGQLAQQSGASAQVKEFGAQMVQDHSKANDELKQIAGAKGVALPTELDSKHMKVMDRLKKTSGAAFDRAYMSDMLADHKEDIGDFTKESGSGKDAEVKAFAAKTLPTLQSHLQMAQSAHAATMKGSSAMAGGASAAGK